MNAKPTGLRIEIHGDIVKLSGPRDLMGRILDLPWLNYVTIDGQIQTAILDPIPEAGAVAANHALHRAREEARKHGQNVYPISGAVARSV